MNSKEALNSIADKFAIKEYDKDGNLIKWVGTIDKEYLKIFKDLEMLDILKHLIEIIPNNATDTKRLLNIRIKPCHIIDDEILLEIKEWLENETL